MRQNTHLGFKDNTSNVGFRPSFTLDHYMGDFTHEWSVSETRDRVKPFLTFSLGAARLATPVESRMRFAFGFGTGVKVFLNQRWGFRIQVEYLPTVMNAEVQKALARPELQQQFQALGFTPVGGTPAEFGALLKSEDEKWRRVVQAAGIKSE